MNKQQLKEARAKSPSELTKEELQTIFGIFSFLIKEYYSGENNISFEIHFRRTFIIRVDYPKKIGAMSFENEFVNFDEGSDGFSMGRAKDMAELLKLFVNMFYNNLLVKAHYKCYFDEENSPYSSQEECQEYLEYVQSII